MGTLVPTIAFIEISTCMLYWADERRSKHKLGMSLRDLIR